MDYEQYLLGKLAEECAEVGQRALKAAQFGLDEVQPGQALDNAERLHAELDELQAIVELLNVHHGLNYTLGLGVSWNWGSSMSGYRELASGITEVVAGGMHVFRDEAIKRQQAKVDALLAELKNTLTSGASE